jgi:membrane protein DedA with SNARE-associated domain
VQGLEAILLQIIHGIYNSTGWAGVVIMMAIESAAIPLPSEVIMPLAGWMLIQANGSPWQWTLLAAFYGAVGNVIGSAVAYWVGALGGRPLVERYGRYVLISHHDLDLAERWFARYGEWAVFFSRLLPVVRTFISVPAGIARMPFWRFCIFTFLGALPWSWGLSFAGYHLGEHWEEVRAVMRPFDIPIILAILALVGLFIYRHVKRARPLGPQAVEE